MFEKVKEFVRSMSKRKRDEYEAANDTESRADATEGLINVAMELARRTGEREQPDIFHSVPSSEGWELISYVYEGEEDITVTKHVVVGFFVRRDGRMRVVSTINALELDDSMDIGPCSNEMWVLKNPKGACYLIGGEHQGEVNEDDIMFELKKKMGVKKIS